MSKNVNNEVGLNDPLFGVVFFVPKSLSELKNKRNFKICNFHLKAFNLIGPEC